MLASDEILGCEIESEGIRSAPLQRKLWEIKRDDSLRGDYRMECVTKPLSGDALRYALWSYCQNAAIAREPFSWRCSTHFHINLLDLEPAQVASLALLSYAADNYFYAAGAEARRENYNCRPLSLLLPMAEVLGTLARRMSRGHANQGCQDLTRTRSDRNAYIARYSGMNWFSLPTFGTLEVRHFPGSRDFDQLMQWANIVIGLKQVAKSMSVDEVRKLIDQGATKFGAKVFGAEWKNLRYPQHEEDWEEFLEGAEYFFACYETNPESRQSLDGILRNHSVIQ